MKLDFQNIFTTMNKANAKTTRKNNIQLKISNEYAMDMKQVMNMLIIYIASKIHHTTSYLSITMSYS